MECTKMAYKKGEVVKEQISNLFPVSKELADKEKMQVDEFVVARIIEVVDPIKRKVKFEVLDVSGTAALKGKFNEGDEVVSFVPSTFMNAINNEIFPIGEERFITYKGTKKPEKANAAGTRTPYHVFEFAEVVQG